MAEADRPVIGAAERLSLGSMGSFDWDMTTGALDLDSGARLVFGMHPDDHDGSAASLTSHIPPDERARLRTAMESAVDDGRDAYGLYFKVVHGNGTRRWTHTRGRIQWQVRLVRIRDHRGRTTPRLLCPVHEFVRR